jgi:hypothetical protein
MQSVGNDGWGVSLKGCSTPDRKLYVVFGKSRILFGVSHDNLKPRSGFSIEGRADGFDV